MSRPAGSARRAKARAACSIVREPGERAALLDADIEALRGLLNGLCRNPLGAEWPRIWRSARARSRSPCRSGAILRS